MLFLNSSYVLCTVGIDKILLQVFAEGNLDSSVNSIVGVGAKPKGGSLSAPVAKISKSFVVHSESRSKISALRQKHS